MTDEFFVAVKEFNLSWAEIKQLSENSLRFAFLPHAKKADLLDRYRESIVGFELKLSKTGISGLSRSPSPKRGFICRRYGICSR